MSDLYSNDTIREKAEQLVHQNVHYCVSYLISQIARPDNGVDSETMLRGFGLDYEDLADILEILDWEEPADQYIRNDMDRSDLISFLEDNDVELARGQGPDEDDDVVLETNELRTLAIAKLDETEEHEEFCQERNIEPDRSEVYEHWIVDNWFAGKLEAQGHPIARDFLGMTIWGRPTTGQGIAMDYVVLRIAKELLES